MLDSSLEIKRSFDFCFDYLGSTFCHSAVLTLLVMSTLATQSEIFFNIRKSIFLLNFWQRFFNFHVLGLISPSSDG
ncbi:MAG: hypothetical protein LBJ32_02450 [Oscillospiraceae bacterium]|nr:hypothetical protein [Oscillospiraceae bacterium]